MYTVQATTLKLELALFVHLVSSILWLRLRQKVNKHVCMHCMHYQLIAHTVLTFEPFDMWDL